MIADGSAKQQVRVFVIAGDTTTTDVCVQRWASADRSSLLELDPAVQRGVSIIAGIASWRRATALGRTGVVTARYRRRRTEYTASRMPPPSRLATLGLPAMLAAALAAQGSQWSRIDTAPNPDSVAVWDSHRQRVLAFERGSSGEYWEWDGQRWTRRFGISPPHPAFSRHAGAYDSVRGELVLAGNGGQAFDGRHWQQIPGLSAAQHSQLAFDPARDRLFAYHGFSSGFMQVREWNGAAWTNVPVPATGPSARAGAAITYDATNQRIVMYGGAVTSQTPYTVLSDCWSWNGTVWSQISASSPPGARQGHTIAHDPGAGRIVLYGGNVGGTQTWTLTGTTWARLNTTADPGWRLGPNLVWDGNGMLLFGGYGESHWRLQNDDWVRLREEPTRRIYGSFAYDEARGELVLFGGGYAQAPFSDTWTFDGAWQRRAPQTSPPPRSQAGLAWSQSNGGLLLFGGIDNGTFLTDTWLWDGTDWLLQSPSSSPPPRGSPAMAPDPQGGVLLFGDQFAGLLRDHWYWNGSDWLQQPQPPLPAMAPVVAGYDPVRQRSLVFGAAGLSPLVTALWEWDGQQWTQITLPGQLLVYPYSVCFRPDTGRMLLDGAIEAWEWDGAQFYGPVWSNYPVGTYPRTTVGAPAFGGAAAYPLTRVYDGNSAPSLGLFTATPAAAERYGNGCALNIVPALSLRGRVGPAYPAAEIVAATGAAFAPALFSLALSQQGVPLGGGCELLVGSAIGTAIAGTGASGDASLALPVPPSAAFLGVEFVTQCATFDPPNSVFGGVTLSDGLLVTIGR